jgi:hypothetical protein
MYRQGDVMLVKIDEIPKDANKLNDKQIVLAYGEITGHAHVMLAEKEQDIIAYKNGEELYLSVFANAILKHGELKKIQTTIGDHDSIKIQPGNYQVIRQREYTPEQIRRVTD